MFASISGWQNFWSVALLWRFLVIQLQRGFALDGDYLLVTAAALRISVTMESERFPPMGKLI